jgi:transcriptional regulator with XRE-family HTH domain
MTNHTRQNLLRLMADRGLSMGQMSELADMDERTIRGILNGSNRPHAKTLRRLADGLGVSVDELFIDPSRLLYRRFDQKTNPIVSEVMEAHSELFAGWNESDFDELHSRVGTGGALTFEGTLEAVRHMNLKHEIHQKIDVLLESSRERELVGIINVLYDSVTSEIG